MSQDQHKVVRCKFEDQGGTRATPDEDAASDAAADAATHTTPQHGGAAAAAGGVERPLAPSPLGKSGGGKVGGVGRKAAKA